MLHAWYGLMERVKKKKKSSPRRTAAGAIIDGRKDSRIQVTNSIDTWHSYPGARYPELPRYSHVYKGYYVPHGCLGFVSTTKNAEYFSVPGL